MKKVKKFIIPLLVVIGVYLISYDYVVNTFIAPKQLGNIYGEVLKDVGKEDMRNNLDRLREGSGEEFNFAEVELLDNVEVNPYINKENVIGGIYIPSVGINMPIMYGATNENLKSAVGTLKPEQEMGKGNYAIAGHNAKNPDILFAPIRRILDGDLMYITDKEKIYVYQKVWHDVVMPERVDVIGDVAGSKLLTLVSCYSADGSDRIIVKGKLLTIYNYDEAPKEVQKAFKGI